MDFKFFKPLKFIGFSLFLNDFYHLPFKEQSDYRIPFLCAAYLCCDKLVK